MKEWTAYFNSPNLLVFPGLATDKNSSKKSFMQARQLWYMWELYNKYTKMFLSSTDMEDITKHP